MPDLITSAEYPAIRAALDTNLETNDLPDATIGLTIYKGAAVQDVLDQDPTAESRSGEEFNHVQRAAIFFCAARLAPAVVRITSINIQTRDLSYSRKIFDPERRAAELRQMAEDELSEVLEPSEEAPGMPTMFTRSKGRRGR